MPSSSVGSRTSTAASRISAGRAVVAGQSFAPPPARPTAPSDERVRMLVGAALSEDIGAGDATTDALVPPGARARGRLIAKEELVVCGLAFAREAFRALDPGTRWKETTDEGALVASGATIAEVEGSARAVLTAERTALNFLQRLSGIATSARRAVAEVSGTRAVVLDTRKTTPTLRDLEKYAVRTGGAANHRAGLSEAVLVKDNHIAICGGIAEAVRRARAAGYEPGTIEVEVDDLAGLREALGCGVGRVLLDNFSPDEAACAVSEAAGRARIEVSGGLRPGALRAFADSGAEFLSLGSLTHSARAVDISLEVEALP